MLLAQKKIRIAILATMMAAGLALPAEQTDAVTAGMTWTQQGSSFTPNDPLQELYSTLDNNKLYVDNDLGGAVALVKLTAAQVKSLAPTGNVFNMPWNSPVVFANYDPGSDSGTIFVVRLIKQPNGQAIIEMAQFTPQMGQVFAQDFQNTNPFWQFIPGQNGNGAGPNGGSFVSITPAAFNTAVGLVMQHVQSAIGWIAAASTNAHMSTSSSGSLFTSTVTHKETAMTSPVWTAVVPDGVSGGSGSGYLLPVPGSAGSSPAQAVDFLQIGQENNAHNVGGLTTAVAQFGNNYLGQLEVNSGYVFVPAGNGSTLPTAAFQSFFHETSKTGFTGLFFDFIMAVVMAVATVVTAGAAAVGFGALAGFLTGMVYDTVATGSPGFTALQTRLVGGNCGGSNAGSSACTSAPPTTMSAAYTAAQEFDGYQEGYTSADTNPTAQNSQWDYTPASSSAIEQDPQNVQGGFGQGYNATTLTPAQAVKGEGLTQLAKQAQKNSDGFIAFGTQTQGVGGSAP